MASRQNRSEVALCINLVHELQELIIGSRRAFISGNACVVDRQSMLDKLNELDTDGVEPLTHLFAEENVFREDTVVNGDSREEMLANAPEVKEGQYVVPKTIGGTK